MWGYSIGSNHIGGSGGGGDAGALPLSVSFASAVPVPEVVVGTVSLSGFDGNVSFASAT